MDDHALLQEELHWRSRPGKRRRPPGSNAITALGLVVTLVLWGVTGIVLTPLLSGSPGSGVVDPKAIVVIVVFGIEMLIAAAISTKAWIAIGPGARSVLRPFGILGPLPMLAIGFLVLVMVASIFAAPFLPKQAKPLTKGKNWRIVPPVARDDRYGVTYERAQQICSATGERLPRKEDLALFDPPYTPATIVWLEKPAGESYEITLTKDGTVARIARQHWQTAGSQAHVLCFRP